MLWNVHNMPDMCISDMCETWETKYGNADVKWNMLSRMQKKMQTALILKNIIN